LPGFSSVPRRKCNPLTQRRPLRPAHFAHGGVARIQRLPGNLPVLALGEEMGIDRQGDVGVGVAELATHEHDIEPPGR
jgi:hypothetical protein